MGRCGPVSGDCSGHLTAQEETLVGEVSSAGVFAFRCAGCAGYDGKRGFTPHKEWQCSILLANALVVSSTSRSEEHTSELQSLMRSSYAVFCLKKKNTKTKVTHTIQESK